MGVLHSIPLCSRGGPRDIDQNNNDILPTVSSSLASAVATTTQPLSMNVVQPQATSTPRPLSPDPNDLDGIHNENYDDSLASSGSNSGPERSDSGLDHSADELDRRQHFSLDDDDDVDDELHEDDEGVFHEDPLMDETIQLDDDDVIDDPVERPPEPTVPDEAVPSDEDAEIPSYPTTSDAKDPTQQAISTLFSELVGDRPIGHAGR